MAWLLDVNVLVALCDTDHIHHSRCFRWWSRHYTEGWATCPLTENGLVRILGHPNYPAGPRSPELAARVFRRFRDVPEHRFLADDISLLDASRFHDLGGVTSRALTDLYLLALAREHELVFATLATRINPSLIPRGADHFHVLAER